MTDWAVSAAAGGVPTYTAATLRREYPARADSWLAGFAGRVDALAAHWALRLDRSVGGARAVCVLGVDGDDRPVAVKVALDTAMLAREVAALIQWQPSGTVPAVYDAATGAALYEQVVPGSPAGRPSDAPTDSDPVTIEKVVGVLQHLAAVSGAWCHGDLGDELARRFDHAAARLDRFISWRGLGPVLTWARARAVGLHAEAMAAHPSLVHGDFQPKNLLAKGSPTKSSHGRPPDWIAIDPLPGLGDRCVDAALWAVCDIAGPPIADAVALLATGLSLPEDRVAQWATVLGVSEYRPERRWHLSARIATYLDTIDAGVGIGDRDARTVWAARDRSWLMPEGGRQHSEDRLPPR